MTESKVSNRLSKERSNSGANQLFNKERLKQQSVLRRVKRADSSQNKIKKFQTPGSGSCFFWGYRVGNSLRHYNPKNDLLEELVAKVFRNRVREVKGNNLKCILSKISFVGF